MNRLRTNIIHPLVFLLLLFGVIWTQGAQAQEEVVPTFPMDALPPLVSEIHIGVPRNIDFEFIQAMRRYAELDMTLKKDEDGKWTLHWSAGSLLGACTASSISSASPSFYCFSTSGYLSLGVSTYTGATLIGWTKQSTNTSKRMNWGKINKLVIRTEITKHRWVKGVVSRYGAANQLETIVSATIEDPETGSTAFTNHLGEYVLRITDNTQEIKVSYPGTISQTVQLAGTPVDDYNTPQGYAGPIHNVREVALSCKSPLNWYPYRSNICIDLAKTHPVRGSITIGGSATKAEGVSVKVKRTGKATISDAEGKYYLDGRLTGEDTVVFSFPGGQTQEWVLKDRGPLGTAGFHINLHMQCEAGYEWNRGGSGACKAPMPFDFPMAQIKSISWANPNDLSTVMSRLALEATGWRLGAYDAPPPGDDYSPTHVTAGYNDFEMFFENNARDTVIHINMDTRAVMQYPKQSRDNTSTWTKIGHVIDFHNVPFTTGGPGDGEGPPEEQNRQFAVHTELTAPVNKQDLNKIMQWIAKEHAASTPQYCNKAGASCPWDDSVNGGGETAHAWGRLARTDCATGCAIGTDVCAQTLSDQILGPINLFTGLFTAGIDVLADIPALTKPQLINTVSDVAGIPASTLGGANSAAEAALKIGGAESLFSILESIENGLGDVATIMDLSSSGQALVGSIEDQLAANTREQYQEQIQTWSANFAYKFSSNTSWWISDQITSRFPNQNDRGYIMEKYAQYTLVNGLESDGLETAKTIGSILSFEPTGLAAVVTAFLNPDCNFTPAPFPSFNLLSAAQRGEPDPTTRRTSWYFGHPGWSNPELSAELIAHWQF